MTIKQMLSKIKASGLTQRHMAAELGLTQQYVSDLIRDKRGKRPGHATQAAVESLYKKYILDHLAPNLTP